MSSVIDQLALQTPDRLWPPDAVAGMKALVERFPTAETGPMIGAVRFGILGVELRLGEREVQVDLSMPILREDRDAILELAGHEEDGHWLREDLWWSRVHQLCRRWAEAGGLLHRHLEMLWLELDVLESDATQSDSEAQVGLPAPGIFVGFSRSAGGEADAPTRRQLLQEIVLVLTGEIPDPAVFEHLEVCVAALPEAARLQFFGLMLSRGSGVVRFVFAGLSAVEIRPFLETVGWPGNAEALERTLLGLLSDEDRRLLPDRAAVQIDVAARGVQSRLGLELPLDATTQRHQGRVAEERFLRRLADRGLCSAAKLEALLELPGRSLQSWGEVYRVGHTRQIHHIKLAVGGGGEIEAKAYYGRILTIENEPGAPPPDAVSLGEALTGNR
ncbi:MAG: hypothetical protein AAGC60_05355 [Acidobacteriota bacterium]